MVTMMMFSSADDGTTMATMMKSSLVR
jgi:hypothetical protein